MPHQSFDAFWNDPDTIKARRIAGAFGALRIADKLLDAWRTTGKPDLGAFMVLHDQISTLLDEKGVKELERADIAVLENLDR